MTSSPDREPRREPIDPLPPALSSMWRLCKLGYRHEPRLMLAAFVLSLLAALPDALLALWLDAARRRRARAATAAWCARAAIGLGVSAAATWFLRTVSTRVQRRFRDKVTIALESHVARLQASVATIAHHERPDYLDRLVDAARSGLRARPHVHVAVLDLRLDPAPRRHGRAAGVDSSGARAARGVRAADGADLDVAAGGRARRAGARRAGQPAGPPPVHHRDDRAAGQGSARHRHRRAPGRPSAARPGSAGTGRWRAARWGSARVARAGVGGLRPRPTSARSSSCRRASARRPATCCWCSPPGARLSAYIGATVGEIGFLRGFWMDGSRRLAWLEDYAASLVGVGRSAGARRRCAAASASTTCRSPTRARRAWCSTTCR